MAIDVHTIDIINGSNNNRQDRVILGIFSGIVTAAGGGAGATVTLAVSGLDLPAFYNVQVTASQDAVCFVTNKTNTGFTININPRLAANTLAAGTVDYVIYA